MNRIAISIIVVAFNNEPHIAECLRSCVGPVGVDHEVIVVYNKSADATLSIINGVRSQYPGLFTLIENRDNPGLGAARNLGIDAARGEYLLFLDGDDWYMPNALERLTELTRTHDFDMCLFNHVRVYEDLRVTPNPQQRHLWEGYRNAPAERSVILRNLGASWNKIYRRSFLLRHGLRFASGYYEDICFSFPATLLAERYYVVPDVLINYRQRAGSITSSADMRHFDVFAGYEQLMTLLAEKPLWLEQYGLAIYLYARKQVLHILHDGRRLPKGSERKFMGVADRLLADFRCLIGKETISLREYSLACKIYCVYLGIYKISALYNKIMRFQQALKPRHGK